MSQKSHDKPTWIVLVEQRIEQLGTIQKVADELGYARPSLSLAINGKYVGSTDRIEETVLKVLGNFKCPHLEREISPEECIAFKQRDAPTQNPAEMRHWRVCQQCPLACKKKSRKEIF